MGKHFASQKSSFVPGGSKTGVHKRKQGEKQKSYTLDEFPFPVPGNSSVLQHKRESAKQSELLQA